MSPEQLLSPGGWGNFSMGRWEDGGPEKESKLARATQQREGWEPRLLDPHRPLFTAPILQKMGDPGQRSGSKHLSQLSLLSPHEAPGQCLGPKQGNGGCEPRLCGHTGPGSLPGPVLTLGDLST